ncbi:MFS transporter [Nocardioides sp. cx-169]|uniref:MFS transporter n=1 Tax=Nocardioides sp. cx-169 TaxID=2899080 RepID=UPI001E43FC42|nr:MFS transporter [Nocardioides sp. cx-169]MCD4534248.1 MFS transporter [Nocardioides sp. cx-169]
MAPDDAPSGDTGGAAPSPWRSPRFRWFATGNTVNNVGEGIYDIALPLLVYGETGSIVVMGVVAALTPGTLLLGPVLGALADKGGAGRLVVSGLIVQLAAAVILSIMVALDQLSLGPFLALAVVLQLAGAVYRVGWMTGVPEMFPESPVRARGTLSSLFIATTIVGPVFVAVLLPLVGYAGLLWINCLTFVAPLLVHAFGIRPTRRPWQAGTRRIVSNGLRVGFATLRDDARLRKLTLLMLPFDFVESAAVPALALYHLRDTLDVSASRVATLFAVMNVAALVGSLAVSERRVFDPVRVVGVITVASAFALVGASVPVVAVAVAALTILMLLGGAAGSAQSMMVVHFVPQEVFGRASGVLRMVHGVPAVLGPLAVAAMVPVLGTTSVFAILALIAVASAAAVVFARPSNKNLSQEREATSHEVDRT